MHRNNKSLYKCDLKMWKAEFFIFTGFWLINPVCLLDIIELHVPSSTIAYIDVHLDCKYKLSYDEVLYDVKWYQNGKQFFRCEANGSVREFETSGMELHHPGNVQNQSCPVTILKITESSSGNYTCEVSLDYPTYRHVEKSAQLRVVQFPQKIPEGFTTIGNIGGPGITLPSLDGEAMPETTDYLSEFNTSSALMSSECFWLIVTAFVLQKLLAPNKIIC